jgi:hypothetical protein
MKNKNQLSDFKKKFGYILEYKINNESNLMREDFEDDTLEGLEEADEQAPNAEADAQAKPQEPKPAPVPSEPKPAPVAKVEPDPAIEPSVGSAPSEPTNVDVNAEPNVNPNNDLMSGQVQFMEKFIEALERINVNIEVVNQKMDKYQQELNKMRMDVEEVREPTDEEKLQMRALDSYPYNQRVSDVFGDKFRNSEPKQEKFTTEFIPNANLNDRGITDSFNDF